jgi:hypothetical protein
MFVTHGQGQRQEIDLTPPRSPVQEELPLPVCPVGEVIGLGTDEAHAEPPLPGTSPLDEGLRELRSALAAEDATAPTPSSEHDADEHDADEQGGDA